MLRALIRRILAMAIVASLPRSGIAAGEPIQLSVDYVGPLVLGEVAEVPVTIMLHETADVATRPLRIAVNVGAFSPLEKKDSGVYRTKYRLPDHRFPQVALIAVWRETGPDAPIEFLRIPLCAKADLPVETKADAQVVVRVGEIEFGPKTANGAGKVTMPIVVPPGVETVAVVSKSGNDTKVANVAVDVPPYNRLTLAVTPHRIEADGASSATVHAFYDSQVPIPIERVLVRAPAGAISSLGSDQNRHRFQYVPVRGAAEKEIVLDASVKADRASSAKVKIELGTPVPERIVLEPDTKPLIADGSRGQSFRFLVLDRLGLGVPKLDLSVNPAGAVLASLGDLGKGEYEAKLGPIDAYPAGGAIAVAVAVRGRTPLEASLAIGVVPPPWPSTLDVSIDPPLPVAGDEPFTVEMTVGDAAGKGMEGVKLAIAAKPGEAEPVVELGGGRYRTRVRTRSDVDTVLLDVSDGSGHVTVKREASLRVLPHRFGIAPWIGGAFDVRAAPTGGLTLDLRVAAENRLAIAIGTSYRQSVQSVSDAIGTAEGRLHRATVSAGAGYDVLALREFALYAGASFLLTVLHLDVKADFRPDQTTRWARPGFELVLGACFFDVFLELSGSYAHTTTLPDAAGDQYFVPRGTGMLRAGYRFGLF